AGIGGAGCLVRHMEPDAWDRTLAINLSGAFNCCRAIVPQMVERRRGKIVNIASLAARRISKLGGADYTASKWGLVGFTKHLAFELADFGVNVNAVCPGATLTPLVMARTSPEFRDQVAKQVPLGRWLEPEDIAQAVLFLVSKRAAMITGQVLEVEGGQLLGLASDYQEDIKRRTQTSARNINPSLQTGRNQHD
ncbi:MAG: SDR family NAD(P)-dependent oxidoreductase, partial [Desulfarculaceae bacterium]